MEISYLDTGAMYRAVALSALQNNIPLESSEKLDQLLMDMDIQIHSGRIFLNGVDVSQDIRTNEVSMAASKLSTLPEVREKLVTLQKSIAEGQSIVLDGRDIGTVVLPDADYKFFITAKPEIRAKRRLLQDGLDIDTDFDTVLNQILLRDKQDKTRKESPLIKADDAILIDNSLQSEKETLEKILEFIDDGEKS